MKDIKITFKVDENVNELIRKEACERDIPVSQLIREAIKLYFQEVKK